MTSNKTDKQLLGKIRYHLENWFSLTKGEVLMKERMRATRFYKVGDPLRIDAIPIPKLGAGDVLVDVKACGICGSDIHIVYEGVTSTAYSPITLGHEPSGVIAALGPWSGGTIAVPPGLGANDGSLVVRLSFAGISEERVL